MFRLVVIPALPVLALAPITGRFDPPFEAFAAGLLAALFFGKVGLLLAVERSRAFGFTLLDAAKGLGQLVTGGTV